jgi:hypothetical protein
MQLIWICTTIFKIYTELVHLEKFVFCRRDRCDIIQALPSKHTFYKIFFILFSILSFVKYMLWREGRADIMLPQSLPLAKNEFFSVNEFYTITLKENKLEKWEYNYFNKTNTPWVHILILKCSGHIKHELRTLRYLWARSLRIAAFIKKLTAC